MANSYNGWKILNSRPAAKRPGPHRFSTEGGYRHFANNDVADIMATLMWWWHTEIGIVTHWDGWRPLGEAGAARTNHASGTATDTNWFQHPWERARYKDSKGIWRYVYPYGKGYNTGFTTANVRTLRNWQNKLKNSSGTSILRLGLDFQPSDPKRKIQGGVDAMHLEIAYTLSGYRQGHVTPATVRWVADKLRKTYRPPRTFDEIKAYQRVVGVTADGKHGPATIGAIKRYQKSRNVSQTGLWDEATKKAGQPKPPAPKPPKDDELMSDAQYNELKQLITTGNAAVHSLRGERTNAHVKEMEEFAAVKAELAAIRRTLQGVPLESVQAFLAYEVQGFSVAWWLRQGLVLDKDHRQYPSDPGSQADLIQQIFEKVTGKQLVPYDGTQKRPRNSIPFGGDQSEKEES